MFIPSCVCKIELYVECLIGKNMQTCVWNLNLPKMDILSSSRSTLQLLSPSEVTSRLSSPMERIEKVVAGNPVVVFAMSSCCMCHVVKRLLFSLGVNPTVYELDTEPGGAEIEKALMRVGGDVRALPAIYIGGKLVGSLDRLMTAHISGTLVPLLKEAGALWL